MRVGVLCENVVKQSCPTARGACVNPPLLVIVPMVMYLLGILIVGGYACCGDDKGPQGALPTECYRLLKILGPIIKILYQEVINRCPIYYHFWMQTIS